MDARSAEEMADSILLESPLPDAEEEQKQQDEIPIGEPIVPPPNLDFVPFARPFYSKNSSLGPYHQEDLVREVTATPRVEASLVVGVSTFAVPSGSTLPRVDRIKLAQENMELLQVRATECQKILAVSNRTIEYLILVHRVVSN